ncbi:hypothetical protein BH23ACT11_BH23ACT11_29390 [soil metagenome]
MPDATVTKLGVAFYNVVMSRRQAIALGGIMGGLGIFAVMTFLYGDPATAFLAGLLYTVVFLLISRFIPG